PAFGLRPRPRGPRHRPPGRLRLPDIAFCGGPLFARRPDRLPEDCSPEKRPGRSQRVPARWGAGVSAGGGRAPRRCVDPDLRAGAEIRLADERAHYLRHVLRLDPGAPVDLFNGRDGEWRSALAAVAKGHATLAVERQLRTQTAGADLWLVFAPIKRAPLDLVAAKATGLGVAALPPVMTQHTPVERVKPERLGAIAIEAAEQCERLDVPSVHDVVTLEELLAGWSPERRLLLCTESGAAPPIAEALRSQADAAAAPWAVLIGPEGGFA